MALPLLLDIPSVCYTSQLQKIAIPSSADDNYTFTLFHIHIAPMTGVETYSQIFQTGYHAYETGNIYVYDIGSVLENYMADMDGVQKFKFVLGDGTDTIEQSSWVVFCRDLMPSSLTAADFISGYWLTDHLIRFAYKQNYDDQLPFAHTGEQEQGTVQYVALVRRDDGDHYSYLRYFASSPKPMYPGVGYVDTGYWHVIELFQDIIPSGGGEIVSYTVKLGNRVATFFVRDLPCGSMFLYHNRYGCDEYMCLQREQDEKTETDSGTAVCEGVMVPYDVTRTKTFEERTPVLSRKEMRRMEEFLTSNRISSYLPFNNFGRDYPVIIKSYEWKLSDTPGEGNKVKFEWQFASLRTPVIGEGNDPAMVERHDYMTWITEMSVAQ